MTEQSATPGIDTRMPSDVIISAELAQDLEVVRNVDCNPVSDAWGSSEAIAPFRFSEGGHGPVGMHALVIGGGRRLSEVRWVSYVEGSSAGWTEKTPFADNNLPHEVFSVRVAHARTQEAGPSEVYAFLSTVDDIIFFSRLGADGQWTSPMQFLEGGALARLVTAETGQEGSVFYAAREKSPGGRIELVVSYLDQPLIDGLPPVNTCWTPDFDTALQGGHAFAMTAVTYQAEDGEEQRGCCLAVTVDGKLRTWLIEPRDGSPQFIAHQYPDGDVEVGRVVGSFPSADDASRANILCADTVEKKTVLKVVSCRYAVKPGDRIGDEADLAVEYGAPEVIFGQELGQELAAVAHQPDFRGGHLLYCLGKHTDGSLSTLWAVRYLVSSSDGGTEARWGVPVPVGTSFQSVVSAPAECSAFFAHGPQGVSLHFMDAGVWNTSPVRVPDTVTHETVRYRVTAAVAGPEGVPLPHCPVTVSVPGGSPACEVYSGEGTIWVTEEGSQLATDAMGRVTFALRADGLSAPVLEVAAGEETRRINPAGDVIEYLAGRKDGLNPASRKPLAGTFDMQALNEAALPNGTGLLPPDTDPELLESATAAIRRLAGNLVDADAERSGRSKRSLEGGAAEGGFEIDFSGAEGKPFFAVLDAADGDGSEGSRVKRAAGGSWWSGLLEDIWAGIKSATITVVKYVWDATKKKLTLGLQFTADVMRWLDIEAPSDEVIERVMGQVFEKIETTVEQVIDWLKALFDFDAIRNTQKALQELLMKAIGDAKDGAEAHRSAVKEWLKLRENEVADALAGLKKSFTSQGIKGKTESLPQTEHDQELKGLGNSAHANWLQGKISWEHAAGPRTADTGDSILPEDVAEKFMNADKTLISDEDKEKLGEAFSGFSATSIESIFEALEGIASTAFKIGGAAVDLAFDVFASVLGAVKAFLEKKIELWEPVQAVWDWIMPGVVCTPAAIITLMLAVPVTIGYKIMNGADQEPFPGGALPTLGAPSRARRSAPEEEKSPLDTCGQVAGLVRLMGAAVFPALDGFEAAAEPPVVGIAPSPFDLLVRVFAVAEFSIFFLDLALIATADSQSGDILGWTTYGVGAIAVVIAALARVCKRWLKGIADLAVGVLLGTLALGIAGLNIYALAQAIAAEDDKGIQLATAGILFTLSDIVGLGVLVTQHIPAAAPAFPFVVVAKMLTGLVAMSACGHLTMNAYTPKAVPTT
ncbi:hypothetical protein [Streptomyces sp. NPDC002537]